MNFFKAATMSAPLLEAPAQIWACLVEHLRLQGAGVRESGAFLLGGKTDAGRTVMGFVPYEQLQADALNEDFVQLTAASFARLWDLCRREGLSVVADMHTHRFGAGQSRSDCENPMVALAGHIAFIVPRFALGHVRLRDLGMYVYEGNHNWAAYSGFDVEALVRITGSGEAQ